MGEPYIIAHKVRGEPAFDVAEQMQVGEELWWIIPTSGHRAYPYYSLALRELWVDSFIDYGENGKRPFHATLEILVPLMPLDHLDHYACNNAPVRRPSLPPSTLESLA